MECLFSYGTLQREKTQLELFGRKLQGTKDVLKGYKTVTIEIEDEKFLSKGEEKLQTTLVNTKNRKDTLEGIVFDITYEELLLCDRYEPDNYKRTKVKFDSGKEGWIYIAH